MGKRKRRGRDRSPDSEKAAKSDRNKGGHEDSQKDEKKSEAAEVVLCETMPQRKRVSAFSRYAEEKESREETAETEREQKSRSKSASPEVKKRKKHKDKKEKRKNKEDDRENTVEPSGVDDDNQRKSGSEPANISKESESGEKNDLKDDSSQIDTDSKLIIPQSDHDTTDRVHIEDSKDIPLEQKETKSERRDRPKERDGERSKENTKGRPLEEKESQSEPRDRPKERERSKDNERSDDYRQRSANRDRHRKSRWDQPSPQRERDDHKHERRRHDPQEHAAPDIKTFQVGTGKQVIMITKHPSTFSLWGCSSIQSLQGDIDIYGYLLREGVEAVDIFSPSSTSFVTVKTTIPTRIAHGDLAEKLNELEGLEDKVKEDVLSKIDSESTVLLFSENVKKQRLNFVTSISPFQQVFWSKENSEHNRNFKQLGTLPIAFGFDNGVKEIRISPDMKKVAEKFCTSIQNGETPAIAVCGGKNVGKSTMGRYLTNCALNKCRQIAYLECDVGQTEFSPPACVSLHLITEPVLGPPFTHQRQAHKMLYFGAVTPSDDPQYYLSCLKAAYSAYTSLDDRCPLVVNTMGWNQGLGLILLASTVTISSPKYVVQFESDSRNRNLPAVTPQFVMEQDRWPTFIEETEAPPSHDLFKIPSLVDFGEFRSRYHPADHRMLSLLGYMSRFQPSDGPCIPLHAMTPQCVPWGSVAVHVSHAAVPNSQIMYSLNASIVGLCHVPEEMMLSSEDDSLPKFLPGNPICDCLGFGIIRSIDPEKKVFHIISDLTLNESAVNCLIRASLDIPQNLIGSQPSVDGEIPYFGESKDVHGATAIKRRRHLMRRGRTGDQHKQVQ